MISLSIAIVLSLLIIVTGLLIYFDKIKKFTISGKDSISIDTYRVQEYSSILLNIDHEIETIEMNYRRYLLQHLYKCFPVNSPGHKKAVYCICLNHIIRRLKMIGYDGFKESLMDSIDDEPAANCLMKYVLIGGKIDVEEKINCYNEAIVGNPGSTFIEITKQKLEKNLQYKEMIDSFIETYLPIKTPYQPCSQA
jgi:hypothetical protein